MTISGFISATSHATHHVSLVYYLIFHSVLVYCMYASKLSKIPLVGCIKVIYTGIYIYRSFVGWGGDMRLWWVSFVDYGILLRFRTRLVRLLSKMRCEQGTRCLSVTLVISDMKGHEVREAEPHPEINFGRTGL